MKKYRHHLLCIFVTWAVSASHDCPAAERVTFELSGQVVDAQVPPGWDDLGIRPGHSWTGHWSYDADAVGVVPPGYYADAGFHLQLSIDGHGFQTLGTPRYCRITEDPDGGTSSIYHAFDDFHGGLIQTPWDEATPSRTRTAADFFSVQLSGLTLGPLGPGGLPQDMAFANPDPTRNRVRLEGTLGLETFSFDLGVTALQLVPEPSVVGLLGLGALALALRRARP